MKRLEQLLGAITVRTKNTVDQLVGKYLTR
jgi:hypothetical protein